MGEEKLEGWGLRAALAGRTLILLKRQFFGKLGMKEAKENECLYHLTPPWRHLEKLKQKTRRSRGLSAVKSPSRKRYTPPLSTGKLTGSESGQRPPPAFSWLPWLTEVSPTAS